MGERFELFGFKALQVSDILDFFSNLFKIIEKETKEPPKRIVYLGGWCGLTAFLALYCKRVKADIHVIDIEPSTTELARVLIDLGVKYLSADVFDPKAISTIKEIIERPGLTILLLDNGDKEQEFALYTKALKIGDIVLAHDFGASLEDFQKVMGWDGHTYKRWGALEIDYDKIGLASQANRLVPYREGLSARYAWCCRRRES